MLRKNRMKIFRAVISFACFGQERSLLAADAKGGKAECAVSMNNHKWGNDDLLPGVKVNSGAVGRLIQWIQEGYVGLSP